jgi:hypothetical protein
VSVEEYPAVAGSRAAAAGSAALESRYSREVGSEEIRVQDALCARARDAVETAREIAARSRALRSTSAELRLMRST